MRSWALFRTCFSLSYAGKGRITESQRFCFSTSSIVLWLSHEFAAEERREVFLATPRSLLTFCVSLSFLRAFPCNNFLLPSSPFIKPAVSGGTAPLSRRTDGIRFRHAVRPLFFLACLLPTVWVEGVFFFWRTDLLGLLLDGSERTVVAIVVLRQAQTDRQTEERGLHRGDARPIQSIDPTMLWTVL